MRRKIFQVLFIMFLAFVFQFSVIMIKTFFLQPSNIHDKLSDRIFHYNKSLFLYFKNDSVLIVQGLLSDKVYKFPYETRDSIVTLYTGNKNIIDQFVLKNGQLIWFDPISLSLPYFMRYKNESMNLTKLSNSKKVRFLKRLKLAKEIKSSLVKDISKKTGRTEMPQIQNYSVNSDEVDILDEQIPNLEIKFQWEYITPGVNSKWNWAVYHIQISGNKWENI